MRRWAAVRDETRPAWRSTFRCLDIVGWLTASASTSSPTLLSDVRSRSRIRRRVGSARTANVSAGTPTNIRRAVYTCQGLYVGGARMWEHVFVVAGEAT